MIVGCYALHLYCANATTSGGQGCKTPSNLFPAEFAGRNEREARAEARRMGWVFRSGECYCAECAKDKSPSADPVCQQSESL